MSYEHPVLTVSGNEITDTSRALGIEGDGRAVPDHSIGIWPAATNLCTNGGFETNTTGWSTTSPGYWLATGATFARTTAEHKFGTACARLQVAAAQYQGAAFAVTLAAATKYTASIWYKGTSGGANLFLSEADGGNYQQVALSLDTAGLWVRASVTLTTAADTACVVGIRTTITVDADYYIDGIQVELGSVATPYIETDGSTAARAAARVQVPIAGLFTPTQGWVAMRVRMGAASTETLGANSMLAVVRVDDNNYLAVYRANATAGLIMTRIGGGAGQAAKTFSNSAWARGDVLTVIGRWTATGLTGSRDGGAFPAEVAQTTIPTAPTLFDIGAYSAGVALLCGDILWFAAGSGTLTDADAAAINAFGNRPPTPVELPGNPTAAYHPDAGIVVHPIGGPRNKLLS